MSEALQLPIIDLSSTDRISNSNSIRQACMEHGFFYVVNHGVEEELIDKVFEHTSKFFSLPIEEKMNFALKNNRGYVPLYAGKADTSSSSAKGDCKEDLYFGPPADGLNLWPFEEDQPSWRSTIETYHEKVLSAGNKLLSLVALALKLEEDFFHKVDALNESLLVLALTQYPGIYEIYGGSAHSDYGTLTLLMTNGVPGLQVCRDKSKHPQVWEDVPSIKGAFIVNIGDMMERWTNCLFRSTLHRVLSPKQDRYSVVFFMNPGKDCIVECLESCCSESCPPRFPPIRCLDYFEERLRLSYASKS
ncbi:Isopenicillin N synthase [Corchorus capsularis]|uniref:Isopenicillin N synthase n=1 Tax=Corchorus capsularis TaxID=210143 RepID=A0A1R3GNJ4_COCAP|nr:Isopenicillin N synthase [Corchorus capsularis]